MNVYDWEDEDIDKIVEETIDELQELIMKYFHKYRKSFDGNRLEVPVNGGDMTTIFMEARYELKHGEEAAKKFFAKLSKPMYKVKDKDGKYVDGPSAEWPRVSFENDEMGEQK